MSSPKLQLLIICFLFLTCIQDALAQQPDTLWTRTFGGVDKDEGWSIQQTTDGGYLVVGTSRSFTEGIPHFYAIKINNKGELLWTNRFFAQVDNWGKYGRETPDKGYIILAETYSETESTVWLIKFSESGDTLWTNNIKITGFFETFALNMVSDGGFIIIGYHESSSGTDVWLIRTNSFGDTLWTKMIGGPNSQSGWNVEQTTDGGFIIAANTESGISGEDCDWWLVKTNSLGDTIWTKTFGGDSTDWMESVRQTSDGGYVLSGYTKSFGPGKQNLWIIKTNANGDTLWTKTYGDSGLYWSGSLQQTNDDGYIIAGAVQKNINEDVDIFIMRLNRNGKCLWTKIIGGEADDYASSIDITNDNGYVILGNTNSFGAGNYDIYIIKLAPDLTDVNQSDKILPDQFIVQQNYPNPFNSTTNLCFQLPVSCQVKLEVYTILGQKVETVLNEYKTAGYYKIKFNANHLTSGVYIYRISTPQYQQSLKMLLIK